MNKTFRIPRTDLYWAIGLSAFFFVAIIGWLCVSFLLIPKAEGLKSEPSPVLAALLGISILGTMVLVSLYCVAAYCVERFTIQGTRIVFRSVFRNHDFDVAELQSLKWFASPRGSIRFRLLGSTARLYLSNYSKADRLEIIRSLHGLIPSHVQDNWPLFCHKVALPLRDGMPYIVRTDSVRQYYTISRKRYDRMLAIGLPVSVLLAVVLWAWLHFPQIMIFPVFVIAFWLFLRFHVPPEGRAQERLTRNSQGYASFIMFGAIVGSQVVMIGLRLWGIEKSTACGVGCVIAGPALLVMVYLLHKAEKQQRAADEQVTPVAMVDWQRGEDLSRKPGRLTHGFRKLGLVGEPLPWHGGRPLS